MNMSRLKEAAEAIGLLAIIITLITLVVELRQTQSALLSQTYQARAFDAISELVTVAESDHIAPILAATKFGEDRDAVEKLNDVERLRLYQYLRARMIDWDNEHYQYQNGYLMKDFFETTTTNSVITWAPRWRAIGLTEGRKEFREYVDRVLEEATNLEN